MHMSMGEEGIVVGVCHALEPEDQVLGTYRSHALYLAKTGETDSFFEEMYGKEAGCAKGRAGSMHLCAPEHGLICCSAIVASSIPVALGAAFAHKYKGTGRKVAVFFGDGATEEGAFWESLNTACLMKLPVLFVCENNQYAIHVHIRDRQAYDIPEAVRHFGIYVHSSETTDPEVVHQVAADALKSMDRTDMPAFLHFRYHRYLEHVGVQEDYCAGYRCKEDFMAYYDADPFKIQRGRLLANGLKLAEVEAMEREIDTTIERSINRAKQSCFAEESTLLEHVFA